MEEIHIFAIVARLAKKKTPQYLRLAWNIVSYNSFPGYVTLYYLIKSDTRILYIFKMKNENELAAHG